MTDAGPDINLAKSLSVTVVDDEVNMCRMIAASLAKINCKANTYTDAKECLKDLKNEPADIVITDLQMPEVDGIAVIKSVKEFSPSTDIILVTGHADKSVALDALRLGIFDLLEKPFEPIELIETVKRTVRYRSAVKERDLIAEQLSFVSEREAKRWGIDAFVGRSQSIKKTLTDIRLLQKAEKSSVLITGESGTGKELVARAIHFGSPNVSRPFVPVNCSALPSELAESLLFGHTKGAFTGASSEKKGAFDIADGGTLFLDEIGDMPLNIQAKLLRVLEDGVVLPVGKSIGHKVNVRIIAATNSELKNKIEANDFRSDLYYRLSVFTIHLPPLRERKSDIPLLAEHFANLLSAEMSFPHLSKPNGLFSSLKDYSFPGNIRELKNMIECALIRSAGKGLQKEHLSIPGNNEAITEPNTDRQSDFDLLFNLNAIEQLAIKKALEKSEGNISEAARLLGISRTKLYRKMPELKQ